MTDFEKWFAQYEADTSIDTKQEAENTLFAAWKAGYDLAIQSSMELLNIDTLCEIKDLTMPSWDSIDGLVLTGCGSWRGSYDEPCLYIKEDPTGRITSQELKAARESLLTETFYGYKGGEYRYDKHALLNVEQCYSAYSSGAYLQELLLKYPEFRGLLKD